MNNEALALGTVNASLREPVRAGELAMWIRARETTLRRARIALSLFFAEVPLETQVAFLADACIDEKAALEIAREVEPAGQAIPLASRAIW